MRWGIGVLWAAMLLANAVHAQTPTAPPDALIANDVYAFIPDARFVWHGPQAARGVIVWGHGLDSRRADLRGQKPPEFLRGLNEAGYDVVRYDRDPSWDGNTRIDAVVAFLSDGLVELRKRGWRHIVAAGQSRGGINVLNLLKTPGAADVILTTSAAMAGTDGGSVATTGEINFYKLVTDVPQQNTRVLFVQFLDDPFAGNMDKRANRLREYVAPRVSHFVLVDRPDGFHGHSAGATADFAARFGGCVTHFVMDETPPSGC